MARQVPGARPAAGDSPPAAAAAWDGGRDDAGDRVRVTLVAAVIATHCALTYGADGSWFYRETTTAGALARVLEVPIAIGALFAMGTFFFIAGCLVPESLARKGPGRFLLSRAVRLGVPVVLTVAVLVPGIEWVVGRVAGPPAGAAAIWADQAHRLDAGPLWFAAALLLYSLAAAVLGRRPGRDRPLGGRPWTARAAAVTAASIAGVSYLVRTRFAIDTFQVGSLHVWQWGQCLGLFTLGCRLGRAGLGTPGRGLLRGCRWTLAIGVLAVLGLLAGFRDDLDPLGGGWGLPAAAVAVLEGAVSVAASVVVLDLGRRRSAAVGRPVRGAAAAYGAYVLQAPVIVAIALLLRPLPVPVAVKLLVVAPAAVLASFGLGNVLQRTTALSRSGAWRWSPRPPAPRRSIGSP